jgi:inosine-uridine nucleoside N-ribohydrolase
LIWSIRKHTSRDRKQEMKRKIIIDTDPGQDDALAILLALASPELDVLGITAVAGNVPLQLTETNARKICELAGRPDVKVFAGADRPLDASPGDGRICAWQNRP